MGYEAIKLELIEWLTKIQDADTIEYLKIVKDSLTSDHDWWDDLTKEQKSALKRGIQEIEKGKIIALSDL
jgi:hypothetical protein